MNDFTNNITLSGDNNITALGRAVPNALPQNDAPPIQEQEFLASYDPGGNLVSSVPLGQGNLASITALATGTPDGNYAAASTPSTVGNSPALQPLNVEKFTPAGSVVWTATLPTTSQISLFQPAAVIVDASGNIFVAGQISGPNLGGIFFAKFDGSSGKLLWQGEYTSGYLRVQNLAVGPDGSLYVASIGNTTGPGNQPCFLAKLDGGTGDTIWSVASPAGICFNGVAISTGENGYVLGTLNGAQQIGYLAGFSTSNGTLNWQNQFGSSGLRPSNITTDSNGEAVVVGWVLNTDYTQPVTLQDLFVAKVNSDGQALWMQKFGNGFDQRSGGGESSPSPYVVTDSQNNIYVAGVTNGAFSGFQNPNQLGQEFVAKFSPQ